MTRTLIALLALMAGCVTDLDLSGNPEISCQADADCPSEYVCVTPPGRCARETATCVQVSSSGATPLADGTACADARDGICIEAVCVTSVCGDGFTDPAREECDDGDLNSWESGSCRPGCLLPVCGDGVEDPGEQCDDGNATDTDNCLSATHATPCAVNTCGDQVVNASLDGNGLPMEECDDGNLDNEDDCLVDCVANVCGDSIVNPSAEQCDDANDIPNDGCYQCVLSEWIPTVVAGDRESGGDALELNLIEASGLALAPSGQLYVADQYRSQIFEIHPPQPGLPNGVDTLFAGTGLSNVRGDGIPAAMAAFSSPGHMACDFRGNLYIRDFSLVRRVDTQGIVSTVVGGGSNTVIDSIPATDAWLARIHSVAVDGLGNLYVATEEETGFPDTPYLHRVDAQTQIITRYAGWGTERPTRTIAESTDDLRLDKSVALYFADGLLYVVDHEASTDPPISRVYRIDVSTSNAFLVAGGGNTWPPGGASADAIELLGARGVAAAPDGTVYISLRADWYSPSARRDAVVKVTPDGVATSLANSDQPGFAGDGGPVSAARFNSPGQLAVEYSGDLYIADAENHRVRRVDTSGFIETVAGEVANPHMPHSIDAKRLHILRGNEIATDVAGNVYSCAAVFKMVVRIRPDGIAEPFAGTGNTFALASTGDGGPAIEADLLDCAGIAADDVGNVYISDGDGHCVRRVDPAGIITTVVGQCDEDSAGYGGDDGPAGNAQLDGPHGLALDDNGNLVIADTYNHCIRRVLATSGVIASTSTIERAAGTCGTSGNATSQSFNQPLDVGIDVLGRIFVADRNNHAIRRIDLDGTVHLAVGLGGSTADGALVGDADIGEVRTLAFDSSGNLVYGETQSDRVRRVNAVQVGLDRRIEATSRVYTLSGTMGDISDSGEGLDAADATTRSPAAVAVAHDDAILFRSNNMASPSIIRRIDPTTNIVTSVAGAVYPPGDGPLEYSHLGVPTALAQIDDNGTDWLIADFGSTDLQDGRIRRVNRITNTVSTVVGHPLPSGYGDGPAATSPLLSGTAGIACDRPAQHVYFVDEGQRFDPTRFTSDPNFLGQVVWIRRLDLGSDPWLVENVAGMAGRGYEDGAASVARFSSPQGLSVDADNDYLYIADTGNNVIRRMSLSSLQVETVAGSPFERGFAGENVPLEEAVFDGVTAVLVAPGGGMYIADTGNHRVRYVDSEGLIHTVIGDGVPGTAGSGAPATGFQIDSPRGMALDAYGNLFIASRVAVRRIIAGADGVADGTDVVSTIYGEPPRRVYPASATRCINDVAVTESSSGLQDRVMVLDMCQGMLLELQRDDAM